MTSQNSIFIKLKVERFYILEFKISPFHLLSLFPLLVGFDAEKQKQLIHFFVKC